MSSVARVLEVVEPIVSPFLDSQEALAAGQMKFAGEPFEALVVLLRAADRRGVRLEPAVVRQVNEALDGMSPRHQEDAAELRAAMGRLASA